MLQTKDNLLSNEQWEEKIRSSHFFSRLSFPHSMEVARACLKNAGRFLSPLSWQEKLKLKIFLHTKKLDFFQLSEKRFLTREWRDIPFEWQVLIQYLANKKIIKDTDTSCFFAHDKIKIHSFRFKVETLPHIPPQSARGNSVLYPERALSKAVGETLERYFLMLPKSEKRASTEQLEKARRSFLSPTCISQFSKKQKEKNTRFTFDEKNLFSWITGRELGTGREILLPAQSIFYTNTKQIQSEPQLRDRNSNGAAGGFTLEEALLSGIYEAIERDSFLLYWLNNIPPKRLNISEIQDEELITLLERIERYQYEAIFLNTTTDTGIPAVTCVLKEKTGKHPSLSIGGGAGFDISRMLVSSLTEAIMVSGASFQPEDEIELSEEYVPFTDARINLESRIYLWQKTALSSKIENFLTGEIQKVHEAFGEIQRFETKKQELRYVYEKLKSLGVGYEVYYYEIKHEVLKTLGYHVVKVLIPELIHLYLMETHAPLGAKRLKEAVKKMGYTPAETLNPWPHPFP